MEKSFPRAYDHHKDGIFGHIYSVSIIPSLT